MAASGINLMRTVFLPWGGRTPHVESNLNTLSLQSIWNWKQKKTFGLQVTCMAAWCNLLLFDKEFQSGFAWLGSSSRTLTSLLMFALWFLAHIDGDRQGFDLINDH